MVQEGELAKRRIEYNERIASAKLEVRDLPGGVVHALFLGHAVPRIHTPPGTETT